MTRDSFVFYRSFYESIACLDDDDRLACYDAICEYALNGTTPDENVVAEAMLMMAKPSIDKNNERFLNGKLGGRPSANQTKTKPKPSENQTETTAEPYVYEDVYVDVDDKKKARTRARARKNTFTGFTDQHTYDFDKMAFLAKPIGGSS